jgi:hypothetical protein
MDYDFRLGRSQLRRNGWRGLAALALVLTLRAAIVGAIAFYAIPGGAWVIRLIERLV